MGLLRLLSICFFSVTAAASISAQRIATEVKDVRLEQLAAQDKRLRWEAVQPGPCGNTLTYSVFRSTVKDFEVSEENRIAEGVTVTHYISHEPNASQPYFYRVMANRVQGECAAASLRSGKIVTYPLDLGGKYKVTVGDVIEDCNATSTTEIACKTLPSFHAVIAAQGRHEFLLGCLSSDFAHRNWTCVNLPPGPYTVSVHSRTVTVLNAGFSRVTSKGGQLVSPITPEFSVLAFTK
jgi:hypothetical protein